MDAPPTPPPDITAYEYHEATKPTLEHLETEHKKSVIQKVGEAYDKWKVKRFIKIAKRKIEKVRYHEDLEKDNDLRHRLLKSLAEMTEIVDFQEDDGTPLTKQELDQKTNKELLEIFDQLVTFLDERT